MAFTKLLLHLGVRPLAVEVLVVALGIVLFFEPCKLIVVVFSVLTLFASLAALALRKNRLNIFYRFTLIGLLLSHSLPVDLRVYRSARLSVGFASVYMTHRLQARIREAAEQKGLVENTDYIIIDCDPWPVVAPKWCVLITLPTG